LTRAARTDNIHRLYFVWVNLRNVPELLNIGKMPRRHGLRERLDLACPDGRNSCMTRRKKPPADAVKETSERHHRTSLKQ
jgi:hypothetical protein